MIDIYLFLVNRNPLENVEVLYRNGNGFVGSDGYMGASVVRWRWGGG